MHLIVGLGNPGREYAATRHNVGFEVIDALALRLALTARADEFDGRARTKFDGWALDGACGSEKILLLKPTTYMNLSGRAVQAAMAFYQVPASDILIILDDLALPCGRLRLRKEGSSGGHNGLKDIERVLATNQYARLRVGIDAAPQRVPGKDYVLGRFTDAQRQKLDPAIERAVSAVMTWVENGIDTAMNRFNADEQKEGNP